MSEFTMPFGADDLGVTEPVPRRPVTEPLEFVRPPGEPTAVDPALADRQAESSTLPAPDAMAELERKARAAGLDPFDVVNDPSLVAPLGTETRWEDVGHIKPLAQVLYDPVAARIAEPDIDRMVEMGRLRETWMPDTFLGKSTFLGELDQRELSLWNEIADNGGGGRPTPDQQKRLQEITIQKQANYIRPSGGALDTAGQVLQQGPQLLRMGGAGLAGGVAGAALGAPAVGAALGAGYVSFQQSRAAAYRDMRSYDIPHEVAYPMSFLGGALVAGLDTLSFGVAASPALKAFGATKGLEKLAAKGLAPLIKTAMKHPAFAHLVTSFVAEGTTEGAQSIVNWLTAVAANELSPDGARPIPTPVEAAKQAVGEAKVGAFAGGLFGGSAHVASRLTAHITGAENNLETLGRVYDVAEQMKLHERAPEVLKTYADALAEGTAAANVSVPVESLLPLLQKAPAATQAWAASPDVKQRLAVAEQTGARVSLSMGEFLAHIRPLDEGRVLMQEVGLGGEMSATEAKELDAEVKKAQKEIESIAARKEAGSDSRVRVYDDLASQLRGVGYTERAVEVQASLLTSALSALAQRVGQDVEVLYKANPLTVARTATGTTHYKLAERLLSLDLEQRVRDAYIDPVAGVPNERAFREMEHQGEGFFFADPEGVKWMNDTSKGGHGAADAMIRSRARSILALDPNAFRAMGGFVGRAGSEAEMQKMAAALQLENPEMPVDFFWGATPEDAKSKANAAKGVAVKSGARAEGGQRPKGLPETATADALKFDAKENIQPLKQEIVERFAKKGGSEAFSTYVEEMSGLLTARGMAALDFYNSKSKRHILSMDASGIGHIDRFIGDGLADVVVERTALVLSEMGLVQYDGAHPSGDEFVARAGGARPLEALAKAAYERLATLRFEAYDSDNNQVVTLKGVVLGWGVGEGKDAAEQALQKHKAALKKEGKRDDRGEEQQAINGRISRRPATEADRAGLPRLRRDLGARDAGRGAAAPNQAGAGDARGRVDQTFPGFSSLYAARALRQPLRLATPGETAPVDLGAVVPEKAWGAMRDGADYSALTDDQLLGLLAWNDPQGMWDDIRALPLKAQRLGEIKTLSKSWGLNPETVTAFDLKEVAADQGDKALAKLAAEAKGIEEDIEEVGEGPSRGELLDAVAGMVAGMQPAEQTNVVTLFPPRALEQPGPAVPRGFIVSTDDGFKVTLTGNANLSTFLHESGHYLFSLMEKYAAQSPEMAADLAVLRDWAGVKPGEAWSVEALEKFARGFETYLMEGKAPSAALQGVFYTLKAWLKYVYRLLLNLNAPLTDEVRSVMDRLVAPADEIDAARTMLGYKANDDLAKGMTAEQREVYYAQWQEAGRKVEERAENEAIRALKKERTEEFKRIQTEVAAEVADHPVIEAREYLTNPKQDRFMLIPEALAGRKFSRAAVKEMQVGTVGRLGPFLSDDAGALHPDELAPYFGFKSGVEMVRAMIDTPSATAIASHMVKERMTALYPHYDPKGSWVHETVIEAMHDDNAVSLALETELGALYRKAGLTPPIAPATVARRAAAENVGTMSRKQMVPAEYINAETHFLREGQKAYAAKDFLGAAEATRKRVYSRAMWQAMHAAVKDLDKAKAALARYSDLEARGRIGKSSMAELPSGARLGPALRDALHGMAVAAGLATTTEPLQPYTKLIADIRAAGYEVMIDEQMIAGIEAFKGWDNLPFDMAMTIHAAVKNLRHVAAEAGRVTVEGRKVELEEIADKVIEGLTKGGLYNRFGAKKGAEQNVWRVLRAQAEKPETVTVDMDGGEPGYFTRVFMGSAEDGQFEAERRRAERLKQYHALTRKAPKNWHSRMLAKHVGFDGETYTGAEVFAMLLNTGSMSNRDKLIRGYAEKAGRPGWSQEAVTAFIHQVFPDQEVYDFAQAHWDFTSQAALWEDSARVSETLYGIRPIKVEATPFPTPGGGSIPGGYHPIIYDKRAVVNEVVLGHRDGLDAMSDVSPGALFAKHDFTKQRSGYVHPILLDPTALAGHIYEVDHFISNAEGVMMRHRILTHPRVKNAIIASLGYERWENLRNANNFIAADGLILTREKLQVDRILQRLIYNNALLVMGGNVLSGVNQIVQGVPATLAYLGPRGLTAFARSAARFAANPFRIWEETAKLSGEFRATDFHFDRDLRVMMAKEMTGDTWDMVRSRMASVTMTPVVFGQKVVNVITWNAAYDLAIDEGLSREDAVRKANTAVRQAQSAAGPKDMTAVQRSQNGLLRILTSLASYTFALNDLVMPRRLTQKEMTASVVRLLTLTMTGMVMKALYEQLLPELAKEDEERRKGPEKYVQDRWGKSARYALQAQLETLSNVPLIGRTAASVISGREPQYASWVDAGYKATQTIPKAWEDKGLTKADLKAVSDTVGLVTGIPTRHVMFAPGEFMHEYLHNGFDPSPYPLFQHLFLVRPGQKGDK